MNQTWLKIVYISLFLGTIATPYVAVAQTNPESIPSTTESTVKTIKINSISHSISNRTISVGETLSVTIEGTAGAVASVLILGDKQTVREYKAQETTPGVYIAKIVLTRRDRITEGAIIARLQQGSQVVYGAAERVFAVSPNRGNSVTSFSDSTQNSLDSVTPTNNDLSIPLTIVSHQNGEEVANGGLTIKGQTQPSAEVQVKVTSSLSLVGNIIQVEGDTLIDRIVNTDNEGNFTIAVPQNPSAPKGLQYNIEAVAFWQDSQSKPVQLTLIQK